MSLCFTACDLEEETEEDILRILICYLKDCLEQQKKCVRTENVDQKSEVKDENFFVFHA